ncbi:MAG TPA: isochorismatase family protein, partial [Micromonosporaceae bacterium]
DGDPVPSRGATTDELVALASAVRDQPGTTLECILAGCINGFTHDDKDVLARMSQGANRPLNWNVLGVSALNPEGHLSQLAASDYVADHGGRVVALTLPHSVRIRVSFLSGFILEGLPGWRAVLKLPVAERMRELADPAVRQRLREGATSDDAGILRALADWGRYEIIETFAAANRGYQVVVPSDCTASMRGADHHWMALELMSRSIAWVMPSEEILKTLTG